MDGSDALVMVLSMMLSALLGAFGMLLFGGRTALNYLLVKVSRGKKVLLMAKTNFGWRSFVAKKEESTLKWKYDKKPITTSIDFGDITRYMRVDMIFVDADKPAKAIKLKEGELYPNDFDPVVFNNILLRALTRPNLDGVEELKKMLVGVIIIVLLLLFAVIGLYMQIGDLAPQVASAVI